MAKTKIIFDKGTIGFVLEALGYSTDEKGYVVDSKNNYMLDVDGKKFKPNKIIGITKKQFITKESQLIETVPVYVNRDNYTL